MKTYLRVRACVLVSIPNTMKITALFLLYSEQLPSHIMFSITFLPKLDMTFEWHGTAIKIG
jgi:hypothetical protein